MGFLLTITCLLFCGVAQADPFGRTYQEFLDRHVVRERRIGAFALNIVDYEGIVASTKSASSPYRKILEALAVFDPEGLNSREEAIAFWVNAYNIGAIKMIVDHYPTDSIRSTKVNWLRNPWGKKILTVGGRTYSLGQIEHEILLGTLKEPLIHFGIVCASLSCPEISPRAYREETVVEHLGEQARQFLALENKGLRIDRERNEVWFSQIFKFDRATFPEGAKSAVPLISGFLSREDAAYLRTGNYGIRYLDYDWSLNAAHRAEE